MVFVDYQNFEIFNLGLLDLFFLNYKKFQQKLSIVNHVCENHFIIIWVFQCQNCKATWIKGQYVTLLENGICHNFVGTYNFQMTRHQI